MYIKFKYTRKYTNIYVKSMYSANNIFRRKLNPTSPNILTMFIS